MYLLYFGDIPNLVSSCFFNNPLYFPLLIHRIFYLLVSALFPQYQVRREHSSRSFAPPKKYGHVGHQVRAHVGRRSLPYACAIFTYDLWTPRNEPGIFYHVSDVEGREKVERTRLRVGGQTRLLPTRLSSRPLLAGVQPLTFY